MRPGSPEKGLGSGTGTSLSKAQRTKEAEKYLVLNKIDIATEHVCRGVMKNTYCSSRSVLGVKKPKICSWFVLAKNQTVRLLATEKARSERIQ